MVESEVISYKGRLMLFMQIQSPMIVRQLRLLRDLISS